MANQFPRLVRTALQNDSLQVALDRNAEKKKRTRAEIPASLPEVQELRQRAKEIRQDTIGNLDQYMEQFIQTIESNGFVIHHARTAHEARQIVLDLVKGQDTKLIVKSKTMVSEEIHLNQALEDAGLEVVETDLGEYIVQLRGEPPSHIVAPAIHLRREDVGQTFHEKLGTPYTEDIEVMNKTARDSLREKFLSADVGISGVNFGVAETGSICIITNEGNGRMVTTIPRLHIALMGVERLVPTHEDLDTMLRLLPRFATGQKLTSYVSLIQGPRGAQDPDGPEERHLILIDNGRQNLRSTPFEEALLCIRCGSCLDHCPVYREIGGYAYESVYTGPIGSVISPGLFGLQQHGHLAKASTLCGACKDACPVDIDLPKLLLRVRDDYVGQVPQPKIPSIGIRLYTWIMEHPSRLRIGQQLASWGTRLLPRRSGWARWLPSPVSAWTDTRDFPLFAGDPFRKRFEEIHQEAFDVESEGTIPAQEPRTEQHQAINPLDRFVQELDGLSVETIRCGPEDVADRVVEIIRKMDFKKILAWDMSESYAGAVVRACSENHIELHVPRLTRQDPIQRQAQITSFGEVKAGLTGAVAGFADTGTLVLPSSKGQSQLTSLLTTTHIAILQADRIFPTMGAWIETSGKSIIENSQNVVLVTGPSRTADIEMTLSIGVHGPGEVIVFIVE
jgi:L-lactate dehydrogenase complex protein LldF